MKKYNIPEISISITLALSAALIFYFSTNPPQAHGDYTFRIAGALLRGELGLRLNEFPSFLSEMIPYEGKYYSAFPLGSVISMLPIALLFHEPPPVHVIIALIAGACVYFFFQFTTAFNVSYPKRILLALFPVFGTLMWANLGVGGAWFIALGLAVLGEIAALYFTLVRPSPLIAGAFFALAFGNRTELIITAPFYLYFFSRTARLNIVTLSKFVVLPIVLALLTAAYNFARFHSVFDFGYLRIPGMAPLFTHGFLSLHSIPLNAQVMLLDGFGIRSYPFFFPPLGCSMLSTSPFLFLLFRGGGKHAVICWLAIGLLTFVLWCHGDPGGYQFSYRYAMILLPWMFILIASNGPTTLTPIEISLFLVSVAINAAATRAFSYAS